MSKKNYRQLLLDPRWQKKRLEIMSRDSFTCRYCGDKESTLHVHHVFYTPTSEGPWDYKDSTLVTLCHECHSEEGVYLAGARAYLMESIAEAGFWKSSLIDGLGDALSTEVPMSEQECECLIGLISTVMHSRATQRELMANPLADVDHAHANMWNDHMKAHGYKVDQ